MATNPVYSEFQMSAIQEVANIGTGNAATALSQMIGSPIDIAVPNAEFVPLHEAAERIGPVESRVFAVLTGLVGDVPASVLLVFPLEAAQALCGMLGTDADSEMGQSALQEIGNILTASYANAIAGMTGLSIEPEPPAVAVDMLGALVDSVLAMSVVSTDAVLFLQTALKIELAECDFGFLWVPAEGSVAVLLTALGL